MEDDQQQFDKDDYTGLDGQNGENFEHHESIEHSVEDGGDQAMETGGDNTEEISEDDRYLLLVFYFGLFLTIFISIFICLIKFVKYKFNRILVSM